MCEDSVNEWKIAGRKTAEGYKFTNQDTCRNKRKANKGVELEETAEFRATTLLRYTAEWMSEVHAIFAFQQTIRRRTLSPNED